MVSFIFIAFLVVKLKNLKYFCGDGASMKWLIFERFWALTPPNVVRLCWNLNHSYSSWRVTHWFKNFSKTQIFTEIGRSQSLHFFFVFVQLWGHFSPWRRPKSKKVNVSQGKTTPSRYPNITKSRLYLVPIFQEKYDYFLSHFGCFLVKKGAWSHFKGSESKSHRAYTGATIPSIQNMQRVWSHHMPVLSLLVTKVGVFLFSTTFPSLAACLISWCRVGWHQIQILKVANKKARVEISFCPVFIFGDFN